MTETCQEQYLQRHCEKPLGHDGYHKATGIPPHSTAKTIILWPTILPIRKNNRGTDYKPN